jgi:phosphatase NudJ
MSREPIPTWFFAITVVREGERFLLVHERKHGQRWYLPAGRVEPGESLFDGARREAEEETGVPVELEGILKIQHRVFPQGGAKVRVFFLARPEGDTPPLAPPGNEHSLEARWVTLGELDDLPLRAPEVRAVFNQVASGEWPVQPLELLQSDGLDLYL